METREARNLTMVLILYECLQLCMPERSLGLERQIRGAIRTSIIVRMTAELDDTHRDSSSLRSQRGWQCGGKIVIYLRHGIPQSVVV